MKNILLLSTLFLSACVGTNTNSNQATELTHPSTQRESVNEHDFNFGIAAVNLNSDDSDPLILSGNSCITKIPKTDPVYAGKTLATLSYQVNITNSQLSSALGVDANLAGMSANFSGNILAELQKLNHDLDTTISYSLQGSSSRPVSLVNTYSSEFAHDISHCGDQYVSSGTAGIYAIANIMVKFRNMEQKKHSA